MKKVRLGISSLIYINIFNLIAISPSFASDTQSSLSDDAKAKEGKQLCVDHWNKQDPQDPCNEASLMDFSKKADEGVAIVYTSLTGVCVAACIYPAMAAGCTAASLGAAAADIGATIAIGVEGGNLGQQMASLIPTVGMLGTQLMAGASSNASSAAPAAGDAAANTAKTAGSEGSKTAAKSTPSRTGPCVSAVMMGLNTALRWATFKANGDAENAAYRKKVDLMPKDMPIINTLTAQPDNGASSGSGGAGPTQNDPGKKLANTVKDNSGKLDLAKFAESAATAGFAPGIKNFEAMSGKPISDLFDKMANQGLDPFTALAQTAGGALGPSGLQALGEIAGASKTVVDKNKDKISMIAQNNRDQNNFSSTGSSGGGSSKSSAPQMPDFAKLMAGLIPKKPEKAAEAQGTVGFSKTSEKVTKEGFHSSEKSIFDIIGSRYQIVQTKFLTGESIIEGNRMPSSLVPENPYLKK